MSGQMPVLVKVSLGQFVCAHTQVCVVGVLCVGGGGGVPSSQVLKDPRD